MRRVVLVIAGAALTALTAACAEDYGPGPGHHRGYYADNGGYYDGFYDDFYGPFYDGYWGPDNVFLFRATRDGEFRRDEANHFRHEGGQGFRHVHGRMAPHH